MTSQETGAALRFHWFLPTNGDGRGIAGGNHSASAGAIAAIRPPTLRYLGQDVPAAVGGPAPAQRRHRGRVSRAAFLRRLPRQGEPLRADGRVSPHRHPAVARRDRHRHRQPPASRGRQARQAPGAGSAAAREPPWSAATPRSPTASRSTRALASRSSFFPATRTWRRRTGSARASSLSSAAAAAGGIQRTTSGQEFKRCTARAPGCSSGRSGLSTGATPAWAGSPSSRGSA